ncbi:MAG TPA: dihydroxyacetone kinase subunit L [Thermococcus paralvinellae]|uniref:Dihydroxyacetone kinase subunit L n=1 Tax=Thermococcus paralvinellae TaxID=582419 RepID=A0A832ZGQ2_9EURY|nr:dihydroxyacetone kinase subunit L [Thermococcus paralvinellae]HIP89553.1 dihydroxyacetone kinase subunit L [Thermococcus paralvinellae]
MKYTKEYFLRFMEIFAKHLAENKDYLTQLDAAIGDGDHGINMDRGAKTALQRLSDTNPSTPSAVLRTIGMALLSSVGGAAGPLYGTAFMKMSIALGNKEEIDDKELVKALEQALLGIKGLGKAQVGEKTMVDVWEPVVTFLKEEIINGNKELKDVCNELVLLAEERMKATIPMQARKGRASYLGERSIGHQDPGATSSYLFFKSLCEALGGN